MDAFPKALYREGAAFEYEGRSLDMLRVEDATEMEAAQADGWMTLADLVSAPLKPGSFDHDGDGLAGGSKAPPGDVKALRDEYAALAGKKPFPGWDEAELRSRIGKLKDQG